MFKKLVIAVILVVFCLSCNRDNKPKKLIEIPIMTDILYDIAILNGIRENSGNLNFPNDTIRKYNVNSVFRKYNIDSLTFAESNMYYLNLENDTYINMQAEIEKRIKQEISVNKMLLEDKKIEDYFNPFKEVLQVESHIDGIRSLKSSKDLEFNIDSLKVIEKDSLKWKEFMGK